MASTTPASCTMCRCLMQALMLLALATSGSGQIEKGEVRYSNIADWGASSQFKMNVAVGKVSSGDPSDPFDEGSERSLTPCPEQEYQNPSSDACNYPPIEDESADVIKVRIGLRPDVNRISCKVKGPEFTDDNRDCEDPDAEGGVCEPSQPTHIEARMCYSKTAYQERPWRKKNRPFPEISLLCPYLIEKIRINPDEIDSSSEWTATKFFDEFDEVPSATFFVMVHALTQHDGKDDVVCGWDSTEDSTFGFEQQEEVEGSYILTKVAMGRTSGVIAAAIVFSVFSVFFLVTYTIADTVWYNKTGKGLTFGV